MSRASVEEGYFRHALRSILNNLDSTISRLFFVNRHCQYQATWGDPRYLCIHPILASILSDVLVLHGGRSQEIGTRPGRKLWNFTKHQAAPTA